MQPNQQFTIQFTPAAGNRLAEPVNITLPTEALIAIAAFVAQQKQSRPDGAADAMPAAAFLDPRTMLFSRS